MSDAEVDDFWKRYTQFYARLGFCINQWTFVDRSLFECCEIVLKTDETRTAIVYYRWQSFTQRVQLVDELVVATIESNDVEPTNKSTLRKQWKKITKLIEDNIRFRNLIAHHPMQQRQVIRGRVSATDPEKNTIVENTTYFEVATEKKELLRGNKKHEVVGVADLKTHAETIQQIKIEIAEFKHLLGFYLPNPTPSSPR